MSGDLVSRLRAGWRVQTNLLLERDINKECAEAADEIDRLRARVADLERERDGARHFLRIYVHAHEHGASVPPNIDGDARFACELLLPPPKEANDATQG